MQEFGLRVIFAAALSLAGALATYYWAKSHRATVSAGGPNAVARLVSSSNEVMRRPAQRLIWQTITGNESLFPGEAVRTTSEAEAQIEFLGQETTIRLDPDSVIEIQEHDGGINIDFLKGNLFIQSESANSKITVQSGEEKIAVAKSQIAVAKTAVAGPMDVEVFRGDARVTDKHGKVQAKPVNDGKIKVLRPKPDDVIYIKPDAGELVSFYWEPIDSAYEVALEIGSSRNSLGKVDGLPPARGSVGHLQAPLTMHSPLYFRLVAKSARTDLPVRASSVLRAEVRPKIAPFLLEPPRNAILKPEVDQAQRAKGLKVDFRWTNAGELTDLWIEVARSADLKDMIHSGKASEQLGQVIDVLPDPGRVYWRVSGRLPGTRQMISSPLQSFVIQKLGQEAITRPVLRLPKAQAILGLLEAREKGVELSWNAVKNAVEYEVKLRPLSDVKPSAAEPAVMAQMQTQVVKELAATFRDLPTGTYVWSVSAKDEYDQASPESESRRFKIEGVPVLAWADGHLSTKFIYRTEKPLLRAAWVRGPGQPVSWRVRLGTAREPASDSDWRIVQKPEYQFSLQEPGTYLVEAESLDATGVVLARTQVRTVEVEPAPLLPPPDFASEMGDVIQGGQEGQVDLQWQAVPGASSYQLQVKDEEGKVIHSERTKATRTSIEKVKTGEYEVSVQTVDAAGRLGPESPAKALHVPEYSDVPAPKLKTINVK